ncbi:MAG: TRAP transporter small permease [Desulfomicrobium sp.]|uniref:TRAP transporter small permease n=1 Tax=Hoeflea sp. TaxID=1940281 RepID=UPI0025B9B60D|nr:TRAP transporter small permease [Hoeflea sp.]MBU4527428.1 TRAP transporter small permease [Alphaproteobacteria bacterium]MBV1713056.1 TRAP transporter small permease [Desulfomicrobium sp.]MBU4543145.1 TRAP transporter small permease [Alphaproteobacteria bacterium]MBU4551836.1 TRAP transporter small permease [Alphaproteobacteria bacterium]MBV1785425.1 TRAP transporter small permease [Hoeflea sp.]
MMQRLEKLIEYVVIAMMGIVALTIMSEVAARTFFTTSLIVSEELSRYLMIWTAMLAVALVAKDNGHIRINMFTDKLGPKAGLFVATISDLMVIAFLAVLVVYSILQMPRLANQGTVTLGLNMAWVYAAMPVGAGLTILFVARRCWDRLMRTPGTEESPL